MSSRSNWSKLPALLAVFIFSFIGASCSSENKETDIISAYKDGAFFNCLLFTREGLALDTLANETGFVLHEKKSATDVIGQQWRRDAVDGYVVLELDVGTERACSTLVFGGKPDAIIMATEEALVHAELPKNMAFMYVNQENFGGVLTKHYKQGGDARINASLSVVYTAGPGDLVAILTFYYDGK